MPPRHPAGQIDQRLALVFGRVLLGVAVQDGALGLTGLGQRDPIGVLGTRQQPGDHAVLALPNRCGRTFFPHGAVDRLDGDLAGPGRRVRLPAGDQALARLPGGRRQVQRLPDRLIDGLGIQPQHGAQAGGHGRAQMRDVVDLVLVQADSPGQVDLDLVTGGDAADQVGAADPQVLGDGHQGGNVVAGMRILGGQKRVVEIQFAHRDPVGPGRPLRGVVAPDPENLGALGRRGMRLGLSPRDSHRAPEHRRGRHRRVVDDAVDHHRLGLRRHRDRIGRDLGDLPRQVLAAGEVLGAAPGSNVVDAHKPHPTHPAECGKCPVRA